MRVLSLFDGISCAFEALERAKVPITTYKASEICPYAITISKLRHPSIIHLGDVKTIKHQPCDLLIGGSPCQDLCVATKGGKGLSGERSKLFYEYVRVWKESKPAYFILENVATMRIADKNKITEIMGVEPIMIDASLVSAQSRKRFFWTNIPMAGLPTDKGITIRHILEKEIPAGYYNKNIYGSTKGKRIVGEGEGTDTDNKRINKINKTPITTTIGDFVVGRDSGRRVDENGARKDGDPTYPLSRFLELRTDEKTGTLTSVMKDNLIVPVSEKPVIVRRLLPVECERLQGLPDGYTEGISETRRYRCLANAFNVDVVAHILGSLRL